MPQPTVEIDEVIALKGTSEALLCEVDGKEVWIPRSCISEDSEVQDEGDSGVLVIPLWLVKKKPELEAYEP